ncbi:MAG: SirB2 family protein [Pseudomonadota bacterium]
MDWVIHYRTLHHLHMGLALTSGALFTVRGAGLLARQRWSQHVALRRLSVIIDTGLLITALRLLWELRLNPFVMPWLQMKLTVLPLYIVLGMCAFKYARQQELRALCYLAALACYGFIVSVALTRSPWGLFTAW